VQSNIIRRMTDLRQKLIALYAEMAKLTLPECHGCRLPLSCCKPEYCDETMQWARERWGVELQPTNHPKLPLMGPAGCIAAPHLRPICTVYTCDVGSFGCKKNNSAWTEQYWRLREELNDLEAELEFPDENQPVHLNLAKLVDRSDPFRAWGFELPIQVSEVLEVLKSEQLSSPGNPAQTRMEHIQRIAWFVKHGWHDPIEIDVGVPELHCHVDHVIIDGNHRAAAAVVRNDPTIQANASGVVHEIEALR
jgi:hypothetical protein